MSLEHEKQREAKEASAPATDGLHDSIVESPNQPEFHCSATSSRNQDSIEINPLLKPACDEIKAQLKRLKERLLNDSREANATLQAAKKRRTEFEDLLSQLQGTKNRQEHKSARLDCELESVRNFENEASTALAELQQEIAAEAALTAQKRAKLESLKLELSAVTAKLQHFEELNEHETSELAATQRATWCADERLQRQLVQYRKRRVIIQQIFTDIERMKELAASDRAAAELHSKKHQENIAEVKVAEEEILAVNKEAKLMHTRWENALIKLRNVDAKLENVVSKREDTEEKIAAAKREAAKMRVEQGAASEQNWKIGHNVNQSLIRRKEAEKRIAVAKENLLEVTEVQKLAAAATAEVVFKLQQQEAAKKEAELHNEELLVQKNRVAAAYNTLEKKLSSLLEGRCEADGSLRASQQELRVAKTATVEKTAQIFDLEIEIFKLRTSLQEKQGDLDALSINIEDVEKDVRAAMANLEVLQQQLDGIIKIIEQRTRDLQLLHKRKQEREESGMEDEGPDGISVDIKRLKKEISATVDAKSTAQANWSRAQERLLTNSQRHFQLTQALSDAEKKLSETINTLKEVSNCIQVSERETEQLRKKLQSMQKEISRLDGGLDELAKLETTIANDLISQQAKHAAKLEALQNACHNKENKIVATLKQHAKATTETATVETQLQEIIAQKKENRHQIDEKRKLEKGEVEEATELQGQAVALRKKLSAVNKRRNTAAVLLQKAAVASGIDSSDRYAKVIKPRNSGTLAELTAARQRLEALRLEKKNENLSTSGLLRKSDSFSDGGCCGVLTI